MMSGQKSRPCFRVSCCKPPERVGERVLVYYCRTLIRELDLKSRASIMVRRWRPQSEPGAGTEETTS